MGLRLRNVTLSSVMTPGVILGRFDESTAPLPALQASRTILRSRRSYDVASASREQGLYRVRPAAHSRGVEGYWSRDCLALSEPHNRSSLTTRLHLPICSNFWKRMETPMNVSLSSVWYKSYAGSAHPSHRFQRATWWMCMTRQERSDIISIAWAVVMHCLPSS